MDYTIPADEDILETAKKFSRLASLMDKRGSLLNLNINGDFGGGVYRNGVAVIVFDNLKDAISKIEKLFNDVNQE